MSVLKQLVCRCVRGEGGAAIGCSLVRHAVGALREVAGQLGSRAVAPVFETPHPYQKNMVSSDVCHEIDALALPPPLLLGLLVNGMYFRHLVPGTQ